MILKLGTTLCNQKYRLERLIGRGAFAEVYLATHLRLQAPRALKILRRDLPGMGSTEYGDYRNRFNLEARLGAKLDHPHIVRVYDFEQDNNVLILVMEFMSGGSLQDKIDQIREKNQDIPIVDALQIARDIANGLSAFHNLDVVHRDLKPNNILFNGKGKAKVADLGLAQIPGGPSRRSQLSVAAPHPGTPTYMSPEQANIRTHLNSASDIYALGLVLFETLTGRICRNVRPGTQVQDLREDVPIWLDDLLCSMLEEEPQKRPWDGKEVAEILLKNEEISSKVSRINTKQRDKITIQGNEMILTLSPGVDMSLVRISAGHFLDGQKEVSSTKCIWMNTGLANTQ